MPNNLGRTIILGNSIRTGLTLSLAFASLLGVSVPSSAKDPGATAVDMIDAIGRAVAPLKAPAPAPTPPQPKTKYVPVYVQAPKHAARHCWYEGREVYDGEDYVASKVKVCR